MIILLLAACSHSGLGETTPTGDTAPTVAAADCPWVGRWELDELRCNTLPYDPWGDNYAGASMKISQDDAGGCAVAMTLEGDSCERVEDWHFIVPEPGTDGESTTTPTGVEVTFGGIRSCDPAECQMEPDAPACAEGDLTSGPQQLQMTLTGDEIEAYGLLVDTASGCPLDIVTLWKKQ